MSAMRPVRHMPRRAFSAYAAFYAFSFRINIQIIRPQSPLRAGLRRQNRPNMPLKRRESLHICMNIRIMCIFG